MYWSAAARSFRTSAASGVVHDVGRDPVDDPGQVLQRRGRQALGRAERGARAVERAPDALGGLGADGLRHELDRLDAVGELVVDPYRVDARARSARR